jgi:hypothetical protein
MAARTPLALAAVTLLLAGPSAGAQGLRLTPPAGPDFGGVPLPRDPLADFVPRGPRFGLPRQQSGFSPYGSRTPGAQTPGTHERVTLQQVPPSYLREQPKFHVPDYKTRFEMPSWLRWLLGGGGVILAHVLATLFSRKEESRR